MFHFLKKKGWRSISLTGFVICICMIMHLMSKTKSVPLIPDIGAAQYIKSVILQDRFDKIINTY